MAVVKGIYQSAGVYRNPTTGALFQSTTGVIQPPKIPKAPTPKAVSNPVAQTPQQAAPTPAATPIWNEGLSNEAKRLREIEAKRKLKADQQARLDELMGIKANKPVVDPNAAPVWNEGLSNEAKRLREIEAERKLKADQQARLDELMGIKANKGNPVVVADPVVQAPTPAPVVEAPPAAIPDPNAGEDSNAFLKSLAETLFPGNRPIDADRIGKDVLYIDALKRGELVLDRRASARGLTGSGAEMGAFNDFQSSLAAKTAERISDVDQGEAERLVNIQLQDSLRRERAQENYWQHGFDLSELLSKQDPSASIAAALQSSTGITMDQANALANYLKGNYKTTQAGTTTTTGGTPFVPVTPSTINTSNTTPTGITGSLSSSAGWGDTVNSLLGSLFK